MGEKIIRAVLCVPMLVILLASGILRCLCCWVLSPLGWWIKPYLPWWMKNEEPYSTNLEVYISDCIIGAIAIMLVITVILGIFGR